LRQQFVDGVVSLFLFPIGENVMSSFNIVSTASEYDALIETHCLPATVTEIEGIARHARFETLTSAEIEKLNQWFLKHATVCVLRVDSIEFALHVLGAKEVEPTEPYNLVRGSGKEKTYYWCEANSHNRILKTGNLGSLTKEGLMFDIANKFWGVGPVAHIDAFAWILSVQHRLIAYIRVYDELGGENVPSIDLLTVVGMPPQLAATLDRGASKTKQDQEFIDREMFTFEFLAETLEYVPENVEKLRNDLAGQLVTVRNNLWSRLHGTGYHPSGPNAPSTRQALALQACFGELTHGDALQELVAQCWARSVTEDGKKGLWAKYLPPPMVAAAIILASGKDGEQWSEGTTITIDPEVRDTILNALGTCSDEGNEGYSSYLREIAKIKKQPKKPTGLDRWVFWGLVSATVDLLAGEYNPETDYFPSVTPTLVKRLKEGKASYPIFGGIDCGPLEVASDD
jgi:hypothetical protein